MPRVQVYRSEMLNRLSRAVIDRHLALEAIKKEKLAQLVGMGRTTIYKRYNMPETLTASEIRSIAQKLKLSNQEIIELCGIEYKPGN